MIVATTVDDRDGQPVKLCSSAVQADSTSTGVRTRVTQDQIPVQSMVDPYQNRTVTPTPFSTVTLTLISWN